jgi:hypothetical protein
MPSVTDHRTQGSELVRWLQAFGRHLAERRRAAPAPASATDASEDAHRRLTAR